MNKGLSIALVVLGLAVALTGCQATKVRPEAARVLVTRQAAPKTCKYLGSVVGEQGGSFTGAYTSNKALAEGSMNDMKNKAYDMGANYVVLENTSAGNTTSGSWSAYGGSTHGQQTDVTHTGNAYRCPPADIGL